MFSLQMCNIYNSTLSSVCYNVCAYVSFIVFISSEMRYQNNTKDKRYQNKKKNIVLTEYRQKVILYVGNSIKVMFTSCQCLRNIEKKTLKMGNCVLRIHT